MQLRKMAKATPISWFRQQIKQLVEKVIIHQPIVNSINWFSHYHIRSRRSVLKSAEHAVM